MREYFRQVGLAMHGFHEAHGSLPPGFQEYYASWPCDGTPSGTFFGWGWSAFILPHIEQENLADLIDPHDAQYSAADQRTHAGQVITTFVCPSNPEGGTWSECCSGWNTGPRPTDDLRSVSMAGVADSHDMYCDSYRAVRTDGNGVLFNVKRVKMDHVRDGTSQTLLVGEVTGADGSHSSQGPAHFAYFWASWNVQDVAQGINGPGTVPGGRDQSLDPIDGDGGNRHDEFFDEVGFSSFHPMGAHFVFVDGSVHFIGEDISQSVLEHLATRAGGEIVAAEDY